MARVNIQIIRSVSEFAALKADWCDLYDQHIQFDAFNSWHWNWLWWKQYSELGELHIIVVRLDHQVVGIAPLYNSRVQTMRVFGKQNTVRFLGRGGDTSPDYLNVLYRADAADAVIDAITRSLLSDRNIGKLFLEDIPTTSPLFVRFKQAQKRHLGFLRKSPISVCRCEALPETVEQYWQLRSRNARKQNRRRMNVVSRLGTRVRFTRCQTEAEIERVYNALIKLHFMRRNTQSGTESFSTDAYISLHRQWMSHCLANNTLWLYALELDEKVIAVEYAFCEKHRLLFFQTGFDPEFKSLSPGHVLMSRMITDAIDQGVHEIDLLKGDYPYKANYASTTRESSVIHYLKVSGLVR